MRTAVALASQMLTPTDEEMLLACARYHYLTHEQWCRYFEDAAAPSDEPLPGASPKHSALGGRT